jgi:hypothetical protein
MWLQCDSGRLQCVYVALYSIYNGFSLRQNALYMADATSLLAQRDINNIASLDVALPFLGQQRPTTWHTLAQTLAHPTTFLPLLSHTSEVS